MWMVIAIATILVDWNSDNSLIEINLLVLVKLFVGEVLIYLALSFCQKLQLS